MKKLLVLTDYSSNASNAVEWSISLSEQLRANILLYHTVQSVPVTPYYGGGAYVTATAEMIVEEAREKLANIAADLKKRFPGRDGHIEVHYRLGEGDLKDNIGQLTAEEHFDLIIMGARTGGTFEHIFNGSETRQLINHAACPVLIVPAERKPDTIKKIVLATNFNATDFIAVHYLLRWSVLFDVQLEIAHVIVPDKKDDARLQLTFRKELNRLSGQEILYHEIAGNDIFRRLNRLCSETGADLLAMIHYEHGLFARVLGHSNADHALDEQHLPLLIFPPAFTRLKDQNCKK